MTKTGLLAPALLILLRQPDVGDGRVVDPDLGAREPEAIAIPRGRRFDAGDIGSGLDFGDAVGDAPPRRQHIREMRLALERRPWAQGLLQRPFEELWQQLSFDCLLPEPAAMRHLVATEGADRVMLGTNFAGWDQADGIVRAVAELGLPEQDLSAVLAGTARKFLALAG